MKTILALLMMIVSATAAAQISKCIDKSGRVVGYGNECPDGTRSEQSAVKGTPAASPTPASAPQQKSLAERDADFRKRQIEKQEAEAKAEKKSAEAEQRRTACESSQAYLKTLQNGQRVTRTDAKTGERTFLADADYPNEIAKAERSIATSCK
jgi:hypothetical protein